MANSKHILMTGGTGFIGKPLTALFLRLGHRLTILTRRPEHVMYHKPHQVKAISDIGQIADLAPPDWVINLAGEPIIDKPWTARRKQQLRNSRITLTQDLCQQLQQLTEPPKVMISGSATGFYGDTGDRQHQEEDPKGRGFAAELCHDWEQSAIIGTPSNTRLCLIRIGVVLAPQGGMLVKIKWPFKLGFGGRLGSGQQGFSWIALDDLCQLILFLLEHSHCQGVYNATSPNIVTNQQLTQYYGRQIHRPTVLPMPAFILKILLGEAASLLLDSQRVFPSRALADGFQFSHPELESYFNSIL